MSLIIKCACVALLGLVITPVCDAAEFAIRDGDVVVFLGDSITAARTYGKIIENYTLLRFPERKVRFINAGWGGDTAEGGLKRLDRDVFQRGATLLTVAYGINDIGWGMKADSEHKQKYLAAIRGIVEQCQKRGVRVYICSAAVTAEDPSTAEKGFLRQMCDEGMAVSRSLGEGAIDVQRTMRQIQRKVWEANAKAKDQKNKETLHAADGIHLNDYGQIAIAYAILKGLGASAEVSLATIDARERSIVEARGCTVTNLAGGDEQWEFDRLDERLPMNLGLVGLLSYRFVPIPDELNRYMLTIRNLPEGSYEIRVDERSLGRFTSRQLSDGVNIASATPDAWEPGGPWDAQAMLLRSMTDARSELAVAGRLAPASIQHNPELPAIVAQAQQVNETMEQLQRTVARPQRYHFVVRRLPAEQKPTQSP